MPEATHEQVLVDRGLFQQTLDRLLTHLGIKLKMPKVGGAEVDLHLLYKEVTSLGGLDAVTARKQWVLVCDPFKFPASFTNKSFVIKKLYINSLHHYEQVYFHRRQGAVLPPPLIMPSGPSSPKRRRLGKAVSAAVMDPLIVVPDVPSSNSGSTISCIKSLEAGTRFTGVIDCTVNHGHRITIQLPGQCLQGTLYWQSPADVTPRAGPPAGPPKAAPATTHLDEDTAMSQELDSRHNMQSQGLVRAASMPGLPTLTQPRPPRTPYQFFQLGVNKEQLLQLHPGPPSDAKELLPKLMSGLWHQMTPEQHKPFVSMAIRDKARFEREWEEFCRLMADSGRSMHDEVHGEPKSPPTTPNASRLMDPYSATPLQAPAYMANAPAHQLPPPQRLCVGIPMAPPPCVLPSPQQSLMQGLKIRINPSSSLPLGLSLGCGDQTQMSVRLARSPGLDLLPPDMEPEDLDHLCHYQQRDMKPFRFEDQRVSREGEHMNTEAVHMAAACMQHADADADADADAYAMAMVLQGHDVSAAGMAGGGLGMFGCATPEKDSCSLGALGSKTLSP